MSACPSELSCLRCPLPSSSFGSCSVPCQPAPPSYPVYSVLCHHHHLAAVVSRVSLPLRVILFTLSSAIIIIWQLYCPVSACPYELSCLLCPLPSSSFGSCSVPCQPAPTSYPVYAVLCHRHHLAAVVSLVSLPLRVILFTLSSAIIIIWQL